MLSSHEASFQYRFLRSFARAALALAVSAGLAGCGGSGGGGQVMIVPDHSGGSAGLVVESPEVSDANPSAGTGFTLSVRVRNAGGGAVPAATVRFHRSDDAAIAPPDEEVAAEALAELAASESVLASVELTAPQAAGTYYYGACVDAAPGESGAANNCSPPVMVTVPALRTPALEAQFPRSTSPRPNLAALRPSLSTTTPPAGTAIELTASIRNAGGRKAGTSRLRFYRSTDAAITRSDTQTGNTHRTPQMEPARIWTLITSLSAPQAAGTYYYGACVDAVAGESDAANNCSPSVMITVRRQPPPDLVVDSRKVYPAAPAAGGVFSLTVNLRNAGGRSTSGTTLRFYRSADATITTDDTELVAMPRAEQPAGTSYQVNSGVLDAPSSTGTYYYGACVDAVAGESDTTNNCSAALKASVTHSKPNLQVYGWGAGIWRETSLRMSATARNIGGPSPATTMRFYHSTDRTITTDDTEVGSAAVPALKKTQPRTFPTFKTKLIYVPLPSSGTHHYGACVDAVTGESDTTDNCRYIRAVWR